MSWEPASALVRSFERLGPLSSTERECLDRLSEDDHGIEPRRKLIEDGRPCDQIFILKSGWLAEFKQLRDGGRQILNFRLPGEVVGIECLAYSAALHSTAALTFCSVARLSREAFEEVQRDYPRLAMALFMMILRDQAILHAWTVNLGRRPAFARIAHLLLELARRLNIRGLATGPAVPFPLKQQDIADCTGLTAPYVNQILQQMRRQGLIEFGDHTLEIRDAAELAKSAGFRPDYLQAWPRMPELADPRAEPAPRPLTDAKFRLFPTTDLDRVRA
jgi:CRP-like cAMP-binding protein